MTIHYGTLADRVWKSALLISITLFSLNAHSQAMEVPDSCSKIHATCINFCKRTMEMEKCTTCWKDFRSCASEASTKKDYDQVAEAN